MKIDRIKEILSEDSKNFEHLLRMYFSSKEKLNIYPKSINCIENQYFFIARTGKEKSLYIIFFNGQNSLAKKFSGRFIKSEQLEEDTFLLRCEMNNKNAGLIQEIFDFTRPVLIGKENSFGFGDRLGIATPGHIKAVENTGIKPIFAQQSIRELERTARTPEDVIGAAVWGVFQEGWKKGFGADADHLKTTNDIDIMARAGFTMFTIDPGAYVVNDAVRMNNQELTERTEKLPWDILEDSFGNFMKRYDSIKVDFSDDFSLIPDKKEILQGLVKYGEVIAHTASMYRHLKEKHANKPSEVELSVDETDSPTTAFEHYMTVNELKRLGVSLTSLAPRFIGSFEKGIDYKGDLEEFRKEYKKHVEISLKLGQYKISLHSGSDKFSVYKIIGESDAGKFHVKTAGTSYLEALRCIAMKSQPLFREILDFSRDRYDTEKKSYHVSADVKNVSPSDKLNNTELLTLFEHNDFREVLHVTFGKVLTTKAENGEYLFRDRIMSCLDENENTYYSLLEKHFKKHLKDL